MPLSHVFIIASLFSAAFGNIVSPGLEKCLDLKAKLVDGKRQTLEDMEKESVINVQLYACHNKHNQEFEIVGSAIKSKSLKKCLAAAGKKEDTTQNVELAVCDESENQKWDLIAENYAVHKASGKCMDVQALKAGILLGRRMRAVPQKDDEQRSSREIWISSVPMHSDGTCMLSCC